MPLELVTVPCLTDNYAYLVHDADSGQTACVDVPEAAPILAALDARGWTLTDILITHHHGDHIDGVAACARPPAPRHRGRGRCAPPAAARPGGGRADRCIGAARRSRSSTCSGHTVGHVAYYFPTRALVFTADSLMALGCGRLFEGTPAQMWDSLSKLAALPPETLVCSGHEYTAANVRFALSLEPGNPALISRAKSDRGRTRAGRADRPLEPVRRTCDQPLPARRICRSEGARSAWPMRGCRRFCRNPRPQGQVLNAFTGDCDRPRPEAITFCT